MDLELIRKYNVPGPRYTSYPTVPYWQPNPPMLMEWKDSVRKAFNKVNENEGLSLYLHLPFCESLCTYCGCNTRITVNHKVEEPYVVTLLKEWDLYLELFGKRPLIREIHLGGGTPTFFSADNLAMLIDGLTANAIVADDAEFSFEAHPGNTSVAHLQTLYDLGFNRISLGIQDFDPVVQKTINRVQTYEQVETITHQARHIGYASINYDLIYGLPCQNAEGLSKTIDLVKQLRPDRIAFYSYAHVPWLKPAQRAFTKEQLPTDAEKRALCELGTEKLLESGYLDVGMDHFALPQDALVLARQNRELHRNFMGYTTKGTGLLIGLGASAISDSWTGMVQNAKKVEDYKAMVNEGQFPFFRGHLLSDEDLMIRQLIIDLMCKFRGAWDDSFYDLPGVDMVFEQLKELERDGAVILEGNTLQVTERGEPLIRNICMCFDLQLLRSRPETAVFSATV